MARFRAAVLCACFLIGPSAHGQLDWVPQVGVVPPFHPAARLAWDHDRGRLLLVGTLPGHGFCDVWARLGTKWAPVSTGQAPSRRERHALAFDRLRGRLVLFGGLTYSGGAGWCGVGHVHGDGCHADTWELAGGEWIQRNPERAPPAREGHAMAWDEARGRTVLFGGQPCRCRKVPSLGDTWEWDGEQWTEATGGPGPRPRTGPALAFDSARRTVVLFGGASFEGNERSTPYADTWEWDGSVWSRRSPLRSPPARREAGLACDSRRRRLVLFGGWGEGGAMNDTWEWDGTTWSEAPPAHRPPSGLPKAFAFDAGRARVVLHYGELLEGETWEWDGRDWLRAGGPPAPTARFGHAMAWDDARARLVFFGGRDQTIRGDTWEWDGTHWEERFECAPEPRLGHAMAYDPVRRRTFVFGGSTVSGELGDTWEWDGHAWTQPAISWTAGSPPMAPTPGPRTHATMAHDARRDRMVLFGGEFAGEPLSETWEWNGMAWSQALPSRQPLPLTRASMAWHAATGNVVLFGGQDEKGLARSETWEWDGTEWTEASVLQKPAKRWGHGLVQARGDRLVLFGGTTNRGVCFSDAWEWNGSYWTQVSTSVHPSPRATFGLAFDPVRAALVLFGGVPGGNPERGLPPGDAFGDLWTMRDR